MEKSLVCFFSASGITRGKAKELAIEIGADLYEIIPKVTYTDDDLDWHNPNSRSSIEINDKSFRPEINEITTNVSDYETIYIGFPIWWGIAPNVIKTFIDNVDLSNKKIVTFCTSGSSDLLPATEDLQSTYPSLNIENGRRL